MMRPFSRLRPAGPRWLALLLLLASFVFAGAQPNVPPPALELKLAKWQGDILAGELRITFAEHMHAYQNPPTEDWMIPIEVTTEAKGVKLEKATYPKGLLKTVGGIETPAAVYDGTITVGVRFKATGKDRPSKIEVKLRFQQCDDNSCYMPAMAKATGAVGTLTKPTLPPAAPPKTGAGKAEQAAATTTSEEGGLGRFLSDSFRTGNYFAIILACVAIGLVLCLTPCVYPVIPITVSFFSNQTAGSLLGRVGLGLMYMAGIAITYGVLGGVAAALGGSVGSLFNQPWFLFLLAAFMVALGLSMFGLYEIGIPPAIGKHIKGRQGPIGALIMGLLVGVAAAPCAGALVSGAALEVARIGVVPLGVLVFTAIGVGLGLPFVVLGAVSAGIKTLPKSGSWLDAVKATLGVAVMYLAFDYLLKGLGFRSEEPRTAFAWTTFFLAAAVFLLAYKNKGLTVQTLGVKGASVLVLGFFAGGAFTHGQGLVKEAEFAELGVARRIEWQKFTPEAFEAAKASGKPILIDITADWCVKCREIDKAIFQSARGVRAASNIVALKIDHSTGVDPDYIAATTKQFKVVGLPHIVYLRPGGEESETVYEIATIDAFESSLRKAGASW